MKKKKPFLNRCVFIEGIGRVHALGPAGEEHVAALDHGNVFTGDPQKQFDLGMLAADIIAGHAEGKVLWAVRFQEKNA